MPQSKSLGKPFELLSAGVDYATYTVSTGPRGVQLWDRGMKLLEEEYDAGAKRKPWRGFGYLGWTSDHVTLGRRLDGAVIRLSGSLAQQFWRTFHVLSDKCTRLDLAVTGHTDATDFSVAHLAQREARAWKRKNDSRLKVGYYFTDPGGATCTIGSRSSEKYGRIYDKWAEAGQPYSPGDWRWEVEYKGEQARSLAECLYAEKNRVERVGSLTMAFFAERGITVPFDASGGQWRYTVYKEKVSAEDRLEWLHTNVQPLVRELTYQVGERAVLDALGLWPDNHLDGQQLDLAGIGEENGRSG